MFARIVRKGQESSTRSMLANVDEVHAYSKALGLDGDRKLEIPTKTCHQFAAAFADSARLRHVNPIDVLDVSLVDRHGEFASRTRERRDASMGGVPRRLASGKAISRCTGGHLRSVNNTAAALRKARPVRRCVHC